MMKSVSILSANDQLDGKSFSSLPLVQVGAGIARQGSCFILWNSLCVNLAESLSGAPSVTFTLSMALSSTGVALKQRSCSSADAAAALLPLPGPAGALQNVEEEMESLVC